MFWGFVVFALILGGMGLLGRIFMGFNMFVTVMLFLFGGVVLAFGLLLLLVSIVAMA